MTSRVTVQLMLSIIRLVQAVAIIVHHAVRPMAEMPRSASMSPTAQAANGEQRASLVESLYVRNFV
jgi:hypothetical protein